MKLRHWFSALAGGSVFLTSWAQACELRDNGASMTDPVTGIEIQKCAVGQTWTGTACSGAAVELTFDEAVAQYGQGEWRLIAIKETPGLLGRALRCSRQEWGSWSSSPNPGVNPPSAFYTAFDSGVNNGFFRRTSKQRVTLVRLSKSSSSATASSNITTPSTITASNLDTPDRLQMAQANQQQADRAFAGKRRTHDANANSEQPTPGPSEGQTTNRGPVRINVAYCIDSRTRPYTGTLKCSAQRFGYTSVEPGQSVQVFAPDAGLLAWTFACNHPTKPYDVEVGNDSISGRCAAY